MLNLEKACQAVNIRYQTGDGMYVKNGSGTNIALFEDSSNLFLKDNLTTAVATIDTSNGGLIIKNSAGTVEAFIDTSAGSGGQMKIAGDVIDVQANQTNNILEVCFEGVLTGAIDKYGNLQLPSKSAGVQQSVASIP